MGKFSGQETPTPLCKCWTKKDREDTTTRKEGEAGLTEVVYAGEYVICLVLFFKKVGLKHVYVRKRITERKQIEIRYGFTDKILQARKKN